MIFTFGMRVGKLYLISFFGLKGFIESYMFIKDCVFASIDVNYSKKSLANSLWVFSSLLNLEYKK